MIKQICKFSSSKVILHHHCIISFLTNNNLHITVQKIPGGQNVQAFVGTSILIGLCAIPVFGKDTKTGHDLFSQEKPQVRQFYCCLLYVFFEGIASNIIILCYFYQAIVESESKLRKDYMDTKKEQQQQ